MKLQYLDDIEPQQLLKVGPEGHVSLPIYDEYTSYFITDSQRVTSSIIGELKIGDDFMVLKVFKEKKLCWIHILGINKEILGWIAIWGSYKENIHQYGFERICIDLQK